MPVETDDDFWEVGMSMRPTGRCFDDALDFFTETQVPRHLWDYFHVVHGICLNPLTNERLSHGWVERTLGGRIDVIQAALVNDGFSEFKIFFAIPQVAFVAKMRPQRVTRYTLQEAAAENAKSDHFGPWDEEYIALTRSEPVNVYTRRARG